MAGTQSVYGLQRQGNLALHLPWELASCTTTSWADSDIPLRRDQWWTCAERSYSSLFLNSCYMGDRQFIGPLAEKPTTR